MRAIDSESIGPLLSVPPFIEGPHPLCSSGGNLGNGRTRTAMYTDSIEQLRGTAGPRQVTVRAETALAAFTTPSSGGWMMFGKYPS